MPADTWLPQTARLPSYRRINLARRRLLAAMSFVFLLGSYGSLSRGEGALGFCPRGIEAFSFWPIKLALGSGMDFKFERLLVCHQERRSRGFNCFLGISLGESLKCVRYTACRKGYFSFKLLLVLSRASLPEHVDLGLV